MCIRDSVGGNVLTNDFDPEGNSQTVTNNGSITTTKGGTVILNADGGYLYKMCIRDR